MQTIEQHPDCRTVKPFPSIIPAFQRRNQLQTLPVVIEEHLEVAIFLYHALLFVNQQSAGFLLCFKD
ncbi:MAG TPA: hypothetical protein VN300_05780 [Desulfobacterales bacterium]|nr:hypothetical protein [Desulfobacterales bacterium]